MSKKSEDNPSSIKYYVKQFLLRNRQRFSGAAVIDIPAGNGVTSAILKSIGSNPVAFDLFPEYFCAGGLQCSRVNLAESIPVADMCADYVICQEGLEHLSDQLKAFREFNRVLKPNGSLIVTTPNYSNLRAKLSYLLSESERFGSYMPPNEIDSVWMSKQTLSNEIYFGHIFLTGIQKLRVLAKLSGFRIKSIQTTRLKPTSILLFIHLYPFIFLANWIAYIRNMKKCKTVLAEIKKEVYGEVFRLSINPRILIDSHLFIEFEKESSLDRVTQKLVSRDKGFGTT